MSRQVPAAMTTAWSSQAKVGNQRPVVRATIQRCELRRFEYDTAWAQGGSFEADRHRVATFKSIIFGDDSFYREIRNIMSCEWERTVDQDAASCTLVLKNTEIRPIGASPQPDEPDEFDMPGYFTPNRGERPAAQTRWGQVQETGWNHILVPDMIVKTYEGYGINPLVTPARDQNLVQTGTWMIDRVTYGNNGTMTLAMRDLGRLLLDQVAFPPAVPNAEYPLSWQRNQSVNVPSRDAVGGQWQDNLKSFGEATSSNDKYIGEGLTNAPFDEYVSSTGGVDGHHARHAIAPRAADDYTLYWRSTGQDAERDFVWWEFEANSPVPLAALRMSIMGGPFRVYVSVHDGTKWMGRKKIGWKLNGVTGSPGNVDIDAKIPFVTSMIADRFWEFDTALPRAYMAKKIRLTFTRLKRSEVGEHPYRAGLRELKIYTADNLSDLGFAHGEVLKVVGNYGDFTHIVKWVCAWTGFYWPPHSTGLDFMRIQERGEPWTKDWITFTRSDPVLPKGRVWGDFMRTGTGGEADLTVDMFDKKPMMDIINYVRDLTGYLFYIDETGGVVWRMPNLWSLGNYTSPESAGEGVPGKRGRYGRTSEIVVLDEETTLLNYETKLDSTSIRERIFVANVVGGIGTVTKAFNPVRIGLTRTAGWTDQNFKTKRETRVMADMVSARNMFTYKTSTATIPGYPKIQVDDQIRIFERVTSETYYHYVLGIKSSLDMESGEWTYDLSTHWLGENPSDAWVVDVEELDNATRQYLNAVGYEGSNDEDKDE